MMSVVILPCTDRSIAWFLNKRHGTCCLVSNQQLFSMYFLRFYSTVPGCGNVWRISWFLAMDTYLVYPFALTIYNVSALLYIQEMRTLRKLHNCIKELFFRKYSCRLYSYYILLTQNFLDWTYTYIVHSTYIVSDLKIWNCRPKPKLFL